MNKSSGGKREVLGPFLGKAHPGRAGGTASLTGQRGFQPDSGLYCLLPPSLWGDALLGVGSVFPSENVLCGKKRKRHISPQ